MFKSLNKSISTPIAIIIIILCTLLVGGIVVYQYYEIPIPKEKEKAPETIKPLEDETPEDETANWKMYRNEEYEYEIKYPSNFSFFEGNFDNSFQLDLFRATIISEEGIGGMEINIESWTKSGEDFSLLQDWIDREKEGWLDAWGVSISMIEEEMFNLDNVQTTKITITIPSLSFDDPRACCGYGGPGEVIVIFAENNEMKYRIKIWINNNKNEIYTSLSHQILSTFRFLE